MTKSFLYVKDSFESKYKLLLNGREKVGSEILKYSKPFIGYSQIIDGVYENLEDCNPTKKRRLLIAFDDMIGDMESNKKLSPIVTELFLRGRKLDILHCFIMKIPNKKEFHQIASNRSSDIDFKDFMKLYKDFTKESYSFLVRNTSQIIH